MTDTQLCEAIATALRAWSTAPLSDMEVHVWSQLGYEDEDGHVVVAPETGTEVSQGIGSHTAAGYVLVVDLVVVIRAVITFEDTLANRQEIESICTQIQYYLRSDAGRQISAGDQRTQRTSGVTYTYGYMGEEDKPGFKRTCEIRATIRKPSEAVT